MIGLVQFLSEHVITIKWLALSNENDLLVRLIRTALPKSVTDTNLQNTNLQNTDKAELHHQDNHKR